MKKMNTHLIRPTLRGLVLALAVTSLSSYVATATPYATSLTNNGNGSVSFRLNQTTGTNDSAWVISGGVTNTLQTPGGAVLTRGLITTSTNAFLIPSNAVFQVRIKHTGTGLISTNSPTVAFNSPRGVAVNNRPASPYFGWVYAANSAAGTQGKGMFAFTSDLFDILGQGATAKTGGYTFGANDLGAPYHVSIAPDDSVLVTDASTTSGNLISMPPLLGSYSYYLKQLTGSASVPVGISNNHGVVISAFVVGTGSNTKLYTMDEDYQTDPTSPSATEMCSAWVYNIGTGALPWGDAPTRKLMTPYLNGFAGQNQKCEVYGHYLYSNQRRSNPPQHSVYITDLNNLLDPSTYNGSTPWDVVWTSQGESIAEGYSDDVLRDTMTISVSPDQRWLATIIAAGSGTITAPDGSTFATLQDDINLIPLTNGIPNLAARQVFHWGAVANGRDLAFDAAHNLYCMSSGLAYMQSLDIGETTDATTGSDGTFNLASPATAATVQATTPVAQEGGAPGVFTITRTPEDIGNPVTIFYSISGTAVGGVNYNTISNNSVTIPAGQTSATINVTPISDGHPDPVLTATLTLKGSGGYSVGFPSSANVFIADNSSPLLRVTGLSTNIFEGNTNDYAAITIQRWGNTNVDVTLDASSFTFGGTAVKNVDYYLANLPHTIAAGVINDTFPLIYPIRNQTKVGTRSILLTNVAGTGYTVTNNTAATTLTLESLPPATVLFSDNFESDPTGTNWKLAFQSYTNGSTDYTVDYAYDYLNAPNYNLTAIPPAPHSTNNDTKGLYMTVNKNAGVSAGLNLYLKNHTFSGNYALRFDLFLVANSSSTMAAPNFNLVEMVLFGINHDGNHTNWFRNSATGTSLPGSPTASDGLFFDIGSDGQGSGGAENDFGAWSAPTWTNTVSVIGPTNLQNVLATSTRQIFKRPPFISGSSFGGDPANTPGIGAFASPTWVEAEVSQVGTPTGNLITWKINNTVILSYYNTNPVASSATSGTVMVGYCDPWDSVANGSAGSGEASAIIDNLQVVQLDHLPVLTGPANAQANVGGSATFSVAASTVTGTTNYQWYSNGVAVASATGPSLTVNPVLATSYGTYSVAVSDGAYTSYGDATLQPATGPSIVTPPSNLAAVVGGSPTFTVTAAAPSGTTNYQWTYYGTNLPGATARTLTLANVQAVSFGGPYAVIVNDGFNNNVTSTPAATLSHAVQPSITSPSVTSGTNFNLSYSSQLGPAYVVDFKTNVTATAWKPLKTNNGTGGVISVTVVPGTTQGFFRVRLQ
jgi:hypothetical protein